MVATVCGKVDDVNDTNILAVDVDNNEGGSQLKMQSVEKVEDVVIYV